MKRAEKRSHLVDVAAELFNRSGYHATGIDQVIAAAGIAKTTLYRHFSSKEDLIVSVLRRFDENYRADMRAVVDRVDGPGVERLLATFDFLQSWFEQKSFHGCPFVSAAAEYSNRSSPVFQEAKMHKRLLIAYFEELARQAGLEKPAILAERINLLHEGAIAVAHVSGTAEPARCARVMAQHMLHAGGA